MGVTWVTASNGLYDTRMDQGHLYRKQDHQDHQHQPQRHLSRQQHL